MTASTIDGLYHQALGFPAGVLDAVCRQIKLVFGIHATRALMEDRYLSEAAEEAGKSMPLPRVFTPDQIVEVEVVGGAPVKAVVRVPITPSFDLVLAVQPADGFVKTLWLNRKSDTHKTLRTEAYRKP